VPVLILIVILATIGLLSYVSKSTNRLDLPSGLAIPADAESSTIYCTGLTSSAAGASGFITYTNTTNEARSVVATIASDSAEGAVDFSIAAHGTYELNPASSVSGSYFGVKSVVSGAGVIASEATTSSPPATAPCSSEGVTSWFGTGFDTTVGTNSILSVFNPSATPAVYSVDFDTTTGYVAPAPLHGVLIQPYQESAINLDAQIVTTANIGVHISVLRGTVVATGIETLTATQTSSLIAGVTKRSTSLHFPDVTTANNTTADLRLANYTNVSANVTVSVDLAPYSISPFTYTLAPFSSGDLPITPNARIPAAGLASLHVSSSVPIYGSLVTGVGSNVRLTSSATPTRLAVVDPPPGQSFSTVTIVNESHHEEVIDVSPLGSTTSTAVHLARGARASLAAVLGQSTITAPYELKSSRGQFSTTGVLANSLGLGLVTDLNAG